jgi:hypothetical protein
VRRARCNLSATGVALCLLLTGCGAAPESGPGNSIQTPGAQTAREARGIVPQLRMAEDRAAPAVPSSRTQDGPTQDDIARRLDHLASVPRAADTTAIRALSAAATTAAVAAIREEAVFALGDIGGADGQATVTTALSDPDPQVRDAAVQALARQGGDAAVHALGWALAQADRARRPVVVDAIGRIGGPAAIAALRSATRHDDPRVRQAAAEWLDEYGAASPAGARDAILRP